MPDYRTTYGDLAGGLGADLGMSPDAEQQDILNAIFAENEPGVPAFFGAAAIAPRQNIKTSTLELAALTDLFVFREPLSIWTAHLFKTARKTFEHMVGLIESYDAYRKLCRKPRTANGDEAIELLSGERIEFYARSKGGGRGLTAPKVTLDEALFLQSVAMGALLPTMATLRNAQVRYGSSAGVADSEVLRGVRDRGRDGLDPRLAYFEWCAPLQDCETPDCTHLAKRVTGCALDNRELWAAANPALGRRISMETLEQLRLEMPPLEFRREFLGWWDEPAMGLIGIPEYAWESCTAKPDDVSAHPSISVDVALDRTFTSVAVAGVRADGRVQVELVEYRPGTAWVVERCGEMQREWGAAITLDASGPASVLIPDFEAAGFTVSGLPRGEVVQACGGMFDAVTEGTVAHLGDPTLTAAVLAARLKTGESYVFTRKGDIDISPLYAVTLARWAAANAPDYDLLDSVR